MSKTPENWLKLIEIANIDRKISHNSWTTWGISITLLGNIWLKIILKVTTKTVFHPLFCPVLPLKLQFPKTKMAGCSNWSPSHFILKILKSGFKRTNNFNEYQRKISLEIFN